MYRKPCCICHSKSGYYALGKTDGSRLLHVTCTLRVEKTLIRVISARDMPYQSLEGTHSSHSEGILRLFCLASTILAGSTNIIYVSAVSIAEIMIKSSVGKLEVDFDPEEMARHSGFELLDFSANDALPLKELPFHHRDPFDRMLISQGIARDYQIMTHDPKFGMYDCKVLS